jgi:hypothetical protein
LSWVVDTLDGGWTTIRNSANQNKCLGVLNSGTADGSQLVIWDCNGSNDQKWSFNLDMQYMDANGNIYHWWNSGCYAIINYNASSPPGSIWRNDLDSIPPEGHRRLGRTDR